MLPTNHETDVTLQVVFKVASRCNLNCSYCYVYNKGDDTWRHRPVFMPDEVFRAGVERTRRHCLRSRQRSVSLTFHGGEPCLAGAARFDGWCAYAKERLRDVVRVKLCLQTNGTLLDEAWGEVLAKHDVEVGLSMDGPKAMHDRFRVDHRGRGSYDDVMRGIEVLKSVGIPLQVLSVIQFGADGVGIHRHFVSLGAKVINYLFPDFTHETVRPVREQFGETPCADFLVPVFDDWWYTGMIDVKVSLFWNMARLILGGKSELDLLGNQPLRFVFVEADGQIEALDVLRSCQPGLAGTRLTVLNDDFCRIAEVSPLQGRMIFSGMPLSATCQACVERDTCGGGYLPHRFSRERVFDNPSVWCADLLRLFTHIRGRLGVRPNETELRRQVLREMAAEKSPTAPTPSRDDPASD